MATIDHPTAQVRDQPHVPNRLRPERSDVSVAVATHTGWMPRHPDTGGAGQFLDMLGTTLPFAPTERERRERSDPRPSIAERYRDRDDYVARARQAAQ